MRLSACVLQVFVWDQSMSCMARMLSPWTWQGVKNDIQNIKGPVVLIDCLIHSRNAALSLLRVCSNFFFEMCPFQRFQGISIYSKTSRAQAPSNFNQPAITAVLFRLIVGMIPFPDISLYPPLWQSNIAMENHLFFNT